MFVKRSYLFDEMQPELRDRLFQLGEKCRFEEGDYIFRRGDVAHSLYILEKGRVRIAVGESGTVAKTVRCPGDLFGWSSLLGPSSYTASAQCLTPTTVVGFKGTMMNQVLEEAPLEGLAFYRRLAAFVRERLMDSYKALVTYDLEKKPHSYG
jgi:CRP-like cAMP-binding protein